MIKKLLIFASIASLFVVAMPQSVFAETTGYQDGSYILDADEGKHLTDSDWCAVQNKHLNWPDSLKTCNSGGGVISDFDKSTSSYVMMRDLQPEPPISMSCNGTTINMKTNRYRIYVAETGKKITFHKNGFQYYFTSNGPVTIGTIRAEPKSDPDYKCNWTGSFSNGQYETTYLSGITDPSTINAGNGFVIGNDLFAAQVGTNKVDYADSWDAAHFTNHVPYGESEGKSCSTLDIGCWVGKITSGFTNAIKEIVGLVGDLFSWLFVPAADEVSNAFNEFGTFMNAKLGFLAYPFDFIGGVFNAFTSGSSWCNSSSCSKSFGNLFGHNFTVNLGQTQTTMPTLWTWFTGMVRGLTIVALLFAVRQKYRSVTNK